MASEGEGGEGERQSWQQKRAVCGCEGWMVEGSQEQMFVKRERIYVKLLREGIALHQNSNF